MNKYNQTGAANGSVKATAKSDNNRQYFPFSEPHPIPRSEQEEIIDTQVRPETFL